MRVKRVYSCLICGVRVGAVTSAFCHVEAKHRGVKLMPIRLHGTHMFTWSKLVDGYYGESVASLMKGF